MHQKITNLFVLALMIIGLLQISCANENKKPQAQQEATEIVEGEDDDLAFLREDDERRKEEYEQEEAAEQAELDSLNLVLKKSEEELKELKKK